MSRTLRQLSPALPLLPYSTLTTCAFVLAWSTNHLTSELCHAESGSMVPTDSDGANKALSSALPNSILDNVNLSWNTFKSIFLTTMSTYIPNKVVAVRRSLPWLNWDLKALFHKWDSALRRAKKSCKSTHWETYKRLRNKAVAALRFAKRTYFMELSNCLSSPKRFWNAYHALSSNRQRVPHLLTHRSVTAESTPAKANLFNSFFASCFPTSQGTAKRSPTRMDGLSTITCSSEEVASIIQSL